jgi:hypothetical protein
MLGQDNSDSTDLYISLNPSDTLNVHHDTHIESVYFYHRLYSQWNSFLNSFLKYLFILLNAYVLHLSISLTYDLTKAVLMFNTSM